MLKIIIALFVASGLVIGVLSWNRESDHQAQRNTEQGVLLGELEALHNPVVSHLVDEWRTAYPAPSDEQLTELRILAERVKADPSSAGKYTAAEKQKKSDALAFGSPFSGMSTTKPGI